MTSAVFVCIIIVTFEGEGAEPPAAAFSSRNAA